MTTKTKQPKPEAAPTTSPKVGSKRWKMRLSPWWVEGTRVEGTAKNEWERVWWSRVRSSGNGEIVYTSEIYDTEQAMMRTARKMAAALGCALCTIDGEWETP